MSEDADYGLVMPFVCTTSAGGSYDDAAFVAGARMAQLDARLERVAKDATTATVVECIYPEMRAQFDLVAMRLGFRMTTEAWDGAPDEWLIATFTIDGRAAMPDEWEA